MTEKKLFALFVVAILGVGVVWYLADKKLGGTPAGTAQAAESDFEFNDSPISPQDDSSQGLPTGTALPALPGSWIAADSTLTPAPELAGKVVLVDIWSTFCQPCIQSIPANNRLAQKYGPKGLVFAGVSHENKGILIDFKKSVEIQYPLLATSEETLRAFRIEFFPSLFLFDRQGKLVWQGTHVLNSERKLQPAFSRALKTALEAGAAVPAGTKASAAPLPPGEVQLPDEFEKIIAQIKADSKNEQAAEIEASGLALGADMPALKGDWIAANNAEPELKNKVTLIDFFTTSCGTCVESLPHNKIFQRFSPQGFVFVNATPEARELIKEFKQQFPIEYPVLTNCNSLFDICAVKEIPLTLMFSRAGKLIWKGGRVEDNGKLDPVFEKTLTAALAVH